MITVKNKIRFSKGRDGRKQIKTVHPNAPVPEPPPPGRVPRVSRVMALAIQFRFLLEERRLKSIGELAELSHVTQPRMTQIMMLNHLAPDIQEAILFLPRYGQGRAPLIERDLRPIAAVTSWRKQREMWAEIVSFCRFKGGRSR